jgi:[histone H3]-lysine79 N-trimethyltransferase
MKNPCELANLQAAEFNARTCLWGLNAGAVNLLSGDMTTHPKVAEILRKADVVLVNNQAFTPTLNGKLLNMFLDLKEGAKVVSLKPFVPENQQLSVRNVESMEHQFTQRRHEFFDRSVSWTSNGGTWYIATKDLTALKKFRRSNGLDRA